MSCPGLAAFQLARSSALWAPPSRLLANGLRVSFPSARTRTSLSPAPHCKRRQEHFSALDSSTTAAGDFESVVTCSPPPRWSGLSGWSAARERLHDAGGPPMAARKVLIGPPVALGVGCIASVRRGLALLLAGLG